MYNGEDTKAARRTCQREIWRVAFRKLDMIEGARLLSDLGSPRNNRLAKLSGNRVGQHSIRINDQYRICFVWGEQGAEDVEITDYHS